MIERSLKIYIYREKDGVEKKSGRERSEWGIEMESSENEMVHLYNITDTARTWKKSYFILS